ncbi:related to SSM4-Ubiquitin-protein ligase involved in ER-associated protein degradation [Sporisorium reilianum f. sp. reilianum]|uniref:RING-type E3 ubiquitin transferase n=1 Tax=Sporisorium reilianum f. sp. reilianum TaxID=72559 RepID=A0A2N8UIY5_9BASI|nr:related to SSM4-Ubiquitin-protein ligase involved in ER-associated protein degradation [Sporisorium reilianum f. sp. reilianum]
MEDEDTCRICRSGPEPGAPLYHPCKCTGSIRYCHQDCLVQWLQHSRKKYCELCNHSFIFHKKYRNDMPPDGKLPRYLYARRLVIRAVHMSQLAARALVVGFTWLALLPWININVWRFMFWSIDVATWMGVPGSVHPFDVQVPPAVNSSSATTSAGANTTHLGSLGRSRNASASAHTPISMAHAKLALRAFAEKLSHDVFQGQILSCVIVVFFVGVFLLREWILQNMPQNFDLQPNADGGQPIQPLAEAAAVQPVAPEEEQAQMGANFEQRRDQLERLLARLPELEEEDEEEEREHEHDLDLDPETQRERARLARIRRLEQTTMPQALRPEQDEDSDNETGDLDEAIAPSEYGVAWDASRILIALEQLQQPSGSSTQDLRDALGWSEDGARLQSHHESVEDQPESSTHQQSQASPSNTAADLRLDQSVPSDAMDQGASSSTADIEPPSAGSGQQDTAAPAAPQPQTEADPVTGSNDPPLDEPTDAQDDDEAWEDESDTDDRAVPRRLDPADEAALRAAAAAAFPPPIAHPVADDEIDIIAAEAEDPEAEIGLAEEMDGILEAVGMRGPLFGIVQNLFLMIFLCGFVMLAFVMAPYIVGRALGSGPGLVKLLALPVRLLRYVTDPVFDSLIALGANSVWPKVAAAMGMQSAGGQQASEIVATSTPVAGWVQRYLPSMLAGTAAGTTKEAIAAPIASKTSATAAMLVRLLPASVTTSAQWKSASDAFDVALATGLRGSLERIADSIAALFVQLDAHRTGTSSTDRAVCVGFGHAYWLFILFIHQHFSKSDLHRAAAEQSALKMFMDQHVLILKAVSFILIELLVFPLGCGLLFDVCTMPLLAEASIAAWPAKMRAAPLSFAFLRWMGGTIYMFVFAQYVSATRKVLRPGVLCWIRDPNDPSFHPIREILDKKSLTQLRKIGASAVMYAAILVASIGVNTYFVRYAMGWSGVLPLRWRPFDPWTEVPVDLLLVHFAVPWATQRIDPEKVAEAWLSAWWRRASRALRLSSYMVGGELRLDEERRPKGNAVVAAWNALLGRGDVEYVEDGGPCRVPADDKAITSGPLIIPLNADGGPATERLAEAMHKQDTDAEKHTPKPRYTHVYLPSDYRTRIAAILALLWLSHCVLFILALGAPLLLGRRVAGMLRGKGGAEVHDFYAYAVGLTLVLVSARMGRFVRKMWMRRIKRARWVRRPGVYMAVCVLLEAKRVCKAVLLLVGVAGVLPLTIGLLVDQYVLVPLRYTATQLPVLHVGQIWACGVIEARLLLFSARFFGVPDTGLVARFMSNVDHVVRSGLYPRPKVKLAWKRIVLPVALAGSALLLAPVGVAYVLARAGWVQVESREHEQVLMRKAFGAVQSVVLVAVVRGVVRRRMDSWTDLLKDEVFLESTELKNFEAEERGKASRDAAGAGQQGGRDEYAAEGTLPDVLFV